MRYIKNCVTIILVSALITFIPPHTARAHGGEKHEHDHTDNTNNNIHSEKSVQQLIIEMSTHIEAMSSALKQNEHNKIHDLSESMENLLKDMIHNIDNKNKRALGTLGNIQRALDALHHAADDNNTSLADQHLGRLKITHDLLKKQL